MRFIQLETVGSTQDEARALYRKGERGPLWVRADAQTSGRGRRDRSWVSRIGNLYTTLLIPNDCPPAESALHGFATSLAIARTLGSYHPSKAVTLKWPNDVLIGGAKVSGLLVEREPEALLIGIGINLTSHPEDLPYPATDLTTELLKGDISDVAQETDAQAVLTRLSVKVVAQIERLRRDGFDLICKDWLAYAHHRGKRIMVNGQSGTFAGLADDGALCLMQDDGTEVRVHAGDVAFG